MVVGPSVLSLLVIASSRHCFPRRRGHGRQSRTLLSLFVEIRWLKPVLERVLQRGPLLVNHREPGRIAITASIDGGLSKNALKGKAQALSSGAGRAVECITFPFITAVAERESLLHHEIHRLRRRRSALEQRRVADVSHLNRAIRRIDPQITGDTDRPFCRPVDNRVKQRVATTTYLLGPCPVTVRRGEWAIGEISPNSPFGIQRVGIVQGCRVEAWMERFHAAITPFHRLARRCSGRLPIG